jgi:Domain of unknown function (DUF3387)
MEVGDHTLPWNRPYRSFQGLSTGEARGPTGSGGCAAEASGQKRQQNSQVNVSPKPGGSSLPLREAGNRGEDLKLTEDEVAFYDALETNESAVKALGDQNLRFIAQELVKTIRENVTIDWIEKQSVRARLRVMVKKILRKYGYPPDRQEKAIRTVLQQAELLCVDRAG